MSLPVQALPAPTLVVRTDENAIVLGIPSALPMENLRAWLTDQLSEHASEISDLVRLDLGTRELDLFALRNLVGWLRETHGLEVSGIYTRPDCMARFAERQLKLRLFPLSDGDDTWPMPADARNHPDADESPDDGADDEAEGGAEGEAEGEGEAAGEPGPLPYALSPGWSDEDAALVASLETQEPAPERTEPTAMLGDTASEAAAIARAREADVGDEQDTLVEELPTSTAPADVPDPDATPVAADPFEASEGSGHVVTSPEGKRTLSVHRTLRSGAIVRFEGDITLFGDANPGSQLVATGNIVVLGSMKGMAHAGAGGDERGFVFALDLRPTQIRIAHRIATDAARRSDGPTVAVLRDDTIVIEPYRSRLPPR